MHEPITEFPKGNVIGSVKLAKRDQVINVTRIKYGSRTRFVEQVLHQSKHGVRQTAMRKTDDFPKDAIADRYIGEWMGGIIDNRGYRVIHEDPNFRVHETS